MSRAITGGTVYHDGSFQDLEILIGDDGRIQEIAPSVEADERIDVDGGYVLPGAIDSHVHIRGPATSQKEDWWTGTRAAARGGVTTVIDHPSPQSPAIDRETFERKQAYADERALIDYGINAGVMEGWQPDELDALPVTGYGEVFLMGADGLELAGRDIGIDVDGSFFRQALDRLKEVGPVTIHAEDPDQNVDVALEGIRDFSRHAPPESEMAAVRSTLDVVNRPVHFVHLSHPDSVDQVAPTEHSFEYTLHHLFLSLEDAEDLGTAAKVKPPLRTEETRQALWDRLDAADLLVTDHAPHLPEEKDQALSEAPPGLPGLEMLYPLLLDAVIRGRVEIDRVVELLVDGPAAVYGLEDKGRIAVGNDADLMVTDMEPEQITTDHVESRAGWTPYEGMTGIFPRMTVSRGTLVYDGEGFGPRGHGRLVTE